QPTATASITGRPLTISATVTNKIYDGTNAATVALSDNGVSGDVLTPSYTEATFADKDIGTNKTVTVSGIALSGTDAANYAFNTTATAAADITPKALTISGITADGKVYDATAAATIHTGSAALVGVVGSEAVTLDVSSATGALANKTVGTAKTVSVSGATIGGADVGNYTLTQPTLTANITAATLTVSGITANSKVYDGDATATLNTASAALAGVISGDVVALSTASASGAFADKNVGTGKTVTVSGLTISGADSGNYSLMQPATTADINAKGLTVTGI